MCVRAWEWGNTHSMISDCSHQVVLYRDTPRVLSTSSMLASRRALVPNIPFTTCEWERRRGKVYNSSHLTTCQTEGCYNVVMSSSCHSSHLIYLWRPLKVFLHSAVHPSLWSGVGQVTQVIELVTQWDQLCLVALVWSIQHLGTIMHSLYIYVHI